MKLKEILDIHIPIMSDELLFVRAEDCIEVFEVLNKDAKTRYGECEVVRICIDPYYKVIMVCVKKETL